MGFYSMKETLQQVSDAILEKQVTLTVTITPKSKLQKLLQRWGMAPKEKLFEIHPLNFGTMIKISRLLLDIDVEVFKKSTMLDSVYRVLNANGDSIAMIVATAIVNRKKDPDPALVDFIKDNFTAQELLSCVMIVLKQMDVTSFMTSIVSMRGINLLQETSQKMPEEIIASGEPSEQQ